MGGFKRITDDKNRTSEGIIYADTNADLYTTYTWDLQQVLAEVVYSDQTLIMLRDASTPTFTVAKESYIGVNLEYKYAKNISWDDIKLTWYDTGMISYIRKWRESVWSESKGLMPAKNYKKSTILRCFLPGNDDDVTTGYFGWQLVGSWPSSISSGELSYTNSEAKIVEVTLTYDWAEEFEGKEPASFK